MTIRLRLASLRVFKRLRELETEQERVREELRPRGRTLSDPEIETMRVVLETMRDV